MILKGTWFLALLVVTQMLTAQNRMLKIYHSDKSLTQHVVGEVDSMSFSQNPEFDTLYVYQADGTLFQYPISGIDSVTFQDSIPTDSYGGVLSIQGTPNDYFTIQEINGRYCFVTPEGHGFISLGSVHTSAVRETSPNNIFQTKYNSNWNTYNNEVVQNLRSWSFNTAGYGYYSGNGTYPIPCLLDCFPIKNSSWKADADFSYSDVFDPAYQNQVEGAIDAMVKKAGNSKNVMGYYWNDMPQWDLDRTHVKRGTDWLTYYRRLPATAPGKAIYVEYLRERYDDDLDSMKSVYGVSASTWEDLPASSFSATDRNHPSVEADDKGFLRLIAREFYRLQGSLTREKDPHRLIMGERYSLYDQPRYVLEEQRQWVDAFACQTGGTSFDEVKFDTLYQRAGKPILICDHAVSFYTEEYPNTMWNQFPTEEDAGQVYQDYLNAALSKPYILGFHRCQYISRLKGEQLKQGLLDVNAVPYWTLVEYMTVANKSIIKRFSEGKLTGD